MGFFSKSPNSTVTAAKWLGLVTAVWVQAISGNNYTFSNYSDSLKSLMNLTQLQLNNLSVAKDVGKAFGLLAGIASDRIPTPVILLIGSIEGLVGYGAQWLVVSQKISPLKYWQMCIFLCMGGNSTTWMNTAVLVTCMRNFRKNRGPVSGILKGYVGLSTAIFTDVCTALFSDDSATFLFLLAIVPFAVCLAAVFCLRELPPAATAADEKEESRFFAVFNGIAVVVAVYLLIYDMTGTVSDVYSLVFAVILLVLLASPLVIPVYSLFKSWSPDACSGLDEEGQASEALLAQEVVPDSQQKPAASGEKAEDETAVRKGKPAIGEDHTIFEALKTLEFWILFVSFLCGVGTGMMVMNNMGQMGSAMGYSDVSIFVSLISIFGFFGRILSGSVSEHFLKKSGTPRPVWNAAAEIVMAIGFALMAAAVPGNLYVGSVVVGVCYGVRLAVTVPTASELFGLKYFGLVYNVLILNLPLGSLIFSGVIAGLLYDAQATETSGGGNTCYGAHCYRAVYLIMGGASLVGFVLDLWLALRTRSVYAKIGASKRSRRPVE